MPVDQRLMYGAMGAMGGLGGVFASARCGAVGCGSCLGCVGVGVLLIAAALMKRAPKRRIKEGQHGMAQIGN